jgi:hypothetical protein
MGFSNPAAPDPFNSHQMETNLRLNKPEDVQKFIHKKGKTTLGTVANWCSTEKNRLSHLIRNKVWVGNKRVMEEVKKYGEFSKIKLNDQKDQPITPEMAETSRRITALATLFNGTELEADVADAMHLEQWKYQGEDDLTLRTLKQTISSLSQAFQDGELKPSDPSVASIEQDVLLALRTNKKFHKKVSALKAKFPKDSPEAKTLSFLLQKAHIQTKLHALGLNPALADADLKSVNLLFTSRLIYNIVGFQNTTASGAQNHAIQLDANQQILIKKEGKWVAISDIMQDLEVDKGTSLTGLVEKKQPGDPDDKIRQRWNYFSPDGLVPVDRYRHKELYPVEKLSGQDMADLLAHAHTFAPDGQPAVPDPAKTCVIQIFTNPRNLTSHDDNFFLSRLSASQPVHAGIRIIKADGSVYSTGLSGLPEEQALREGAGNLLVTVNSAPAILDFEEFRPHEGRIVTSIAVTPEVFKETMDTLNKYREDTVRFNLARQNCVLLATEVLKKAGVATANQITVGELMSGLIPSPKNIKLVGKPLKVVDRKVGSLKERVIDKTPRPLVKASKIPRRVVWFVPNSISKLLLLGLGGSRGTAKKQAQGIETLENSEEMANFKHLFPSAKEVFKDNSIELYYSLPLIQWQLQQQSTAVHPYEGKPKMGIVPPQGEAAVEGEKRKKIFTKRFVTNFE